MKKYLLFIVTISLAVLLLAGCTGSGKEAEAPPSNSIVNIVWEWQETINQSTGDTQTVPNPENYTITFLEDGTFTGMADCNVIAGTYSTEGGFTISLGPSTLAACGEDSLDQQYTSLLSSIVAGGPDGQGGLALETAGGEQRMMFANGGSAN